MKIKRASGVKRVLYGTAAAGALLASSVSADEVTGSLQLTSPKEETINAGDAIKFAKGKDDVLQIATSGAVTLLDDSYIRVNVTSSDPSASVNTPEIKGQSLRNYGDGLRLDVSGMEPGKLKELVFNQGYVTSEKKALDVTTTYTLVIGGKEVSSQTVVRHFSRNARPFIVKSSGFRYDYFTKDNAITQSEYTFGAQLSGDNGVNMYYYATDLKKSVSDGFSDIESTTDRFVVIDVPSADIVLSELDSSSKLKERDIFKTYRSGNHYRIPYDEFVAKSGLVVFDTSAFAKANAVSDGLTAVMGRVVPATAKMALEYKDTANAVKTVPAVKDVNLYTKITGGMESDTQLRYSQASDLRTSVWGYMSPAVEKTNVVATIDAVGTKGLDLPPLTFSFDSNNGSADHELTLISNMTSLASFSVVDMSTGKEIGTLSNSRLIIPSTIQSIKLVPKTTITMKESLSGKNDELTIRIAPGYNKEGVIKDMIAKKEDERTVFKVVGTLEGVGSCTTTHTVVMDRLLVDGIDTEKLVFTPEETRIFLPLNMSASLEHNTFKKDDYVSLKNDVTFTVTLPDGVRLDPRGGSGYEIVSQNGNAYTLKKVGLSAFVKQDGATATLSDSIWVIVPKGTAVYRFPITVTFNDDVKDKIVDGDKPRSFTATLTTYDVKELLSISDIDYQGKTAKDVVLENENKVTVNSNLISTVSASVDEWESLAYIPQKGIEGSTATAKLTGAITAPKGWKVLYTTDKVSGNREVDGKLTFTETPSDFSRVTAVKYVATEPVKTQSTATFKVPLEMVDGPDAKYVYRTDITTDTVSHILSAPVTVSSKQVLTRYLEQGTNKVLSPEEKGKKDKKDIPEYTFVETKVDGNVTTHYYTRELKTRYLEQGTNNVLSPEEKGKKDKKDIPDYTFVETKVDDNVTTHYYTKELKTRYLEQGTNAVLSPEEKGKHDKKAIPDYSFVETKVEGNVTTHY